MLITREEARKVRALDAAMRDRTATLEDIQEFAELFRKAGASGELSVEAVLRESGFASLDDFARNLTHPSADRAVRELGYASMGLLLAFTMDQALAEDA